MSEFHLNLNKLQLILIVKLKLPHSLSRIVLRSMLRILKRSGYTCWNTLLKSLWQASGWNIESRKTLFNECLLATHDFYPTKIVLNGSASVVCIQVELVKGPYGIHANFVPDVTFQIRTYENDSLSIANLNDQKIGDLNRIEMDALSVIFDLVGGAKIPPYIPKELYWSARLEDQLLP